MRNNIIREVIEIDKDARKQVELLKEEKNKLNDFLRKEKDNIIQKYTNEVNNTIETTKAEIDADIKKRKQEAIDEYQNILDNIEKTFDTHKEEWIDSIYNYCIEDSKKGLI